MTIRTEPSTDPVGTVRRDEQGRLYVRTDEAPPAFWVVISGPPLQPMWRTPGSLADTVVVGAVPGTPAADLIRTNVVDAAVAAAADAMRALLKPFAHDCKATLFGGQIGSLSPSTNEVARAALEAGLPIATAELRADVERLTLDVRELRGQRDPCGEVAATAEPAHTCQDGWIEDANWEPENTEEQRAGRRPGSGLLECPTCTVPAGRQAPADPTATWSEGDVAFDRTGFVHVRYAQGWRTYPRTTGVQYGDTEMETRLGPLVRLDAVPPGTSDIGALPRGYVRGPAAPEEVRRG